MTSDSASTQSSADGRRRYRVNNLAKAHIFINQLQKEAWPAHVQEQGRFLTTDNFGEVLTSSSVSSEKVCGHSNYLTWRAAVFVVQYERVYELEKLPITARRHQLSRESLVAFHVSFRLHLVPRDLQSKGQDRWMDFARAMLDLMLICEDLEYSLV